MARPVLSAEKALVFRIIHRLNLPWVIANGLHCGNGAVRSPSWVSIGNAELISKRATRTVRAGPSGMLGDYVPFYFTPYSVMLHQILTGWNGIQRRQRSDIVILVSSIHKLRELGLTVMFTNMHAYYRWAEFFENPADLDKVDWDLLNRRDFKKDADDPAKFERYQAEALVHRHVPVEALLGIVCFDEPCQREIGQALAAAGLGLSAIARPEWYL